MSRAHQAVFAALIGIALLFALGFRGNWGSLAFTALPPLLVAIAVALRARTATFWAGILALFWFSYGVMEAWTLSGSAQVYAIGITLLSLVVIFAGSWAGLVTRFGKKPEA